MTAPHDFVLDVDAVVFDAVGTLIFPQPSVASAYTAAIRRHCGVDIAERSVREEVRKALGTRSQGDALRTSEAAERSFWANLIRQLCPDSEGFQACFDELFAHFEDASNWRCFPDVELTISELMAADVPQAIASNFDSRLNSVCDGLSQIRGVSERIISSEVGWRKPSPRFFRAVAERLDLPAERILMVGDDLHNDVRGALDVGMRAAWICRDGSPGQPAGVAHPDLVLRSLSELRPLLKSGQPAQRPAVEVPGGGSR